MFRLFKKKTEKEKFTAQYESLLKEAYMLSKTDRRASDAKQAEAQELLEKINQLP
ncbi:MAG: Lacal_2735 family protein [Saprospiraceae bacterium]|nr:Lacal_2735 family protein [Saprospiraceae bacterium]